jgi:uncharacterized protein (TIGR04255 family)
MCADRLKQAPLVEAIVEVQWDAKMQEGPIPTSTDYIPFLARFMQVFQEEYPAREPAPGADAPAEIAAQMHMVQQRFRTAKGAWPLVQVGPTTFTLNETEAYDWGGDFRDRAVRALEKLFKAFDNPDDVLVKSLLLRYIDGIEFDRGDQEILDFLAKSLQTGIRLIPALFEGTGVGQSPIGVDLRWSFACGVPKGVAHLRFASGQSRGRNGIIMETMVQSTDDDVPSLPDGFAGWLDLAHRVTSTWFHAIPNEKLHRRFEGD